ncbi:hypothetical protein F511_06433 [Dorcoceras hygrometricum]|uniref:Uncharacterized protein n=1 Tax=Dorcoceras hygrometricum TaxID=472368 RepID=A0A2Z7AZB8_9LAMI|nr:hypothetical protein F511_06433 [Dorcoceras hygrometricum]
MMYQSQATVDPVVSFSAIAYPVDMVSRRKKSRSSEAWQPGAKYPVDKETAVARSVVTKKRQQLSEQLLNNLLENIQPLQAINAQMEESMAEIKSCKLPEFKETRFALFWEIVQFTEERCTEMERRRRISLDKRRRDLEFI